jgi:hypothetical protein
VRISKLKDLRLGLLINFGDEHLKSGIRRKANYLWTHSFALLFAGLLKLRIP